MKNAKIQNEIQAIFSAIEASIDTRIASASNDNMLKELNTSKRLFTLHLATVLHAENADYKMIAQSIAIADKNHESFFAQKALIKMMQVTRTLSQNIDSLDRYTRNFLHSMLICNGTASNKEIEQGMCKNIVTDNLKLRKNALHIATSTCDTQSSSSRRMLSHLNIIKYDNKTHSQSFASDEMKARVLKFIKTEI